MAGQLCGGPFLGLFISFLPCPEANSKRSVPRVPLSFFVFSLFPLPLFPFDQRPASHCVPPLSSHLFLPFSTYATTAPTLSLASTNSYRHHSLLLSSSAELSFALACHSVDICGYPQLIAPSDLHLTRSTGYPPWIIHVIDVWTRSPLFLPICSPTLLTPTLSVFANDVICRNLTFRMAFFASSQQEFFEHRLRRSSSAASIRFRSRRPSGSQKSLSRSHINSPPHPLPSTSTPDDIPSTERQTTLPPSATKSGSLPSSRTTPLHPRANSMKIVRFPMLLC